MEVELKFHSFYTSALDGSAWSAFCLRPFNLWARSHDDHWKYNLADPGNFWTFWGREWFLDPLEIEDRIIQSAG